MLDTAANHTLDRHQQVAGQHHVATPAPSGSRPRWFVVATHSQAERRATHNLAQQGYETYLPLVTVRRRDAAIRSLLHRVEVPLFTGYLFIRFDAARDPWRPITNTPGVYALLRSSSTGLPEPVRAGAVEALEASQDARRSLPAPGASWAPGTACSPGKGHPLAGHPAVVVSVSHDMALIAVMMFGELREVSVDVNCLMARD